MFRYKYVLLTLQCISSTVTLHAQKSFYKKPQPVYIADSVSLSDAFFPISHNGSQSKAYGWWYAQQLGTIKEQYCAGSCGDKLNLHWIYPQTYTFANACTQIAHHYAFNRFIKYTCHALSAISTCIHTIKTYLRTYWCTLTGSDPTADQVQQPKGNEPYIGLCHESNGKTNAALTYMQLAGKQPMDLKTYCRAWATILHNDPQQIIILFFESHLDKRSTENNALAMNAETTRKKIDTTLEDSGLALFCKKLDASYYTGKKLPTAGQLRTQNKRALIFIDTHDPEIICSHYLNHEQIYRTHWQFNNGSFYADMQLNTCRLKGQQSWDSPRVELYRVDHGPENTAALDLYQLLEAVGHNIETLRTCWLPGNYWKVNAYETLMGRYRYAKERKQQACSDERTHLPTIMMLDFIEIGSIQELKYKLRSQQQTVSPLTG